MSWVTNLMKDLTPVSGIADVYLNGLNAVGAMEEDLCEILSLDLDQGQYATVGGDPYDWSLEIYLFGVAPETFVFTMEQAKTILSWGVRGFWINLGMTAENKRAKTHEIRVFAYPDSEPTISPIRPLSR
jgi:hypothetical protein